MSAASLSLTTLGNAFELGELIVCTRTCEIKDGEKSLGKMFPGEGCRVLADKDGLVQRQKNGGWVPREHFVPERDAVAYFRERIKRNPDDVESRCGLAMRILGSDSDAALTEMAEAVRRKETDVILERKSNVHIFRYEWKEAIAALDRAMVLAPDRLDLRELRSSACINGQQFRKAVIDCNYLLERQGDTSRTLKTRGLAWFGLRDLRRASADFDAAQRLEPDNEEAQVMLTMLHGDPKLVLPRLNLLVEQHPQWASAQKNLGLLLIEAKQFDEAILAFTKSLEVDHREANTFMARGYCWHQQKEFDLAIADFNKAIEITPLDAQGWAGRAEVRRTMKQPEQALEDYSEAIRLSPDSYKHYFGRGLLWEDECEYRLALDDFQKAVELGDKGIPVHRHLAWIYATCPDDNLRSAETARQLVDYIVKVEKTPGLDMLETIAAVTANFGRYDLATKAQREVVPRRQGEKKQAALERLKLYEFGQPYRSPLKLR